MKRFYAQLRPHLAAFIDAIQGITDEQERQAYGQQLVQHLMFLYFLQHHRLLDGDYHYLSHHLQRMHALQPDTFYTHFLLPLSTVVGARFIAPVIGCAVLGDIDHRHDGRDKSGPYDVTIADTAFMNLFSFFDTYRWQLTSESPETEQTLSPAILGYVFEQQINQKQTGAYYTSDDITSYIARTTIIPWLFQMLAYAHPNLFSAHAPTWHRLRDEPERYISPSLATPDYLPTETEREYTLRRQRYTQLHEQLSTGTICAITDLITLNLDIQRFALDALAECDSPTLLLSCYSILTHMSVLDPTCGTGAFLCAATNVLEALHTACLQRLHTLAEHNASCEEIRTILRTVATFPNLRYASIYTILTHNLYGVDIMDGAIEICRQRLLLMLLAHVSVGAGEVDEGGGDPCGRPVGRKGKKGGVFTDEGRPQGSPPPSSTSPAPTEANNSLPDLRNTIRVGNALYGSISAEEMAHFPTQHKPFHWHHEFPTVMERGGFDVIIGNPPYIEHSKLPSSHSLYGYTKYQHGNLYAAVLERSLALCRDGQSYLGLVVPISLCTSERFAPLRQTIMQKTEQQWLAHFEIFPCRLFEGAFQRLCLLIAQCRDGRPQGSPFTMHVTKLQRWYTAERPHLISSMYYTQVQHMIHQHMFPKLASPIHEAILEKLSRKAQGNALAACLSSERTKYVVYYQEATNYWTKATCSTPFYKKNGVLQEPSHGRFLFFHDAYTAQAGMALLNSGLFYLWFATYSDGFHLAHALVKAFPTGQDLYTITLSLLAQRLEQDILQNAQMSTRNTKTGDDIEIAEYRMACSKPLLDQIDSVLAQYYELDEAEYNFIISYDSKYRLGR